MGTPSGVVECGSRITSPATKIGWLCNIDRDFHVVLHSQTSLAAVSPFLYSTLGSYDKDTNLSASLCMASQDHREPVDPATAGKASTGRDNDNDSLAPDANLTPTFC